MKIDRNKVGRRMIFWGLVYLAVNPIRKFLRREKREKENEKSDQNGVGHVEK